MAGKVCRRCLVPIKGVRHFETILRMRCGISLESNDEVKNRIERDEEEEEEKKKVKPNERHERKAAMQTKRVSRAR